jgi:hypothetical protein
MMFKKGIFKDLFKGKDDKPLLVSFILQQDDCSRLLGEFGEKHLQECSKLVLAWQNGSGQIKAIHSDSLSREDAALLLVKATMLMEGCIREQ